MDIYISKHILEDLENIEIADIDLSDAPNFNDAYLKSASWKDGHKLSYKELQFINHVYPDFVYECVINQLEGNN